MVQPEDIDLIYEMDDKGNKTLVCSKLSLHRVYLRFTNKTSRPVHIWWLNYEGHKQLYGRVRAGRQFDIDTYVTHPWQFTDAHTKEVYVINNKPFFRAPAGLGSMNYRTNWNITTTVRSLRTWSLLAVAKHCHFPSTIPCLGLPHVIANDLQQVMTRSVEPEPTQAQPE